MTLKNRKFLRPQRHAAWLLAALFCCASSSRADLARGNRGIVASVSPIASQAGLDALKSGGNAIDAAVAMGVTLGVVDGYNSGIGGGCFMLIHRANGEIIALDGREMAPLTATRDMFVRGGKGDTNLSQTGALASGVPGSVAVYESALKRFGRKKLADLLLPSARIAESGFPLSANYARRLGSAAADLKKFDASRAIFFRPDGTPLGEGDTLRQTDLANSYRALAAQGSKWFYRGEYARLAGDWMQKNGGLITAQDFARYQMKERQPITTTYRGFKVVSFPPPSSGGVHVAQILNILENFPLAKLSDAGRHHVIAEAMKLAFADRAFWLGDPDYARVPRGLVDASYGRDLARRIQLSAATPVPTHGTPPDFDQWVFEKHTTHFSAADAQGNWVACTATINTGFGSKVIVPGTGILLNNQMDDFSIQPGVPNAFGLVGSDANAVAGGKRPLSSMSPTLVLRGRTPILSLGAAGGPTIISSTVQNLIGVLDLGLPLDAALAQPRLHQQWAPDEIRIEKAMPDAIKRALVARGHRLDEVNSIAVAQIVGLDPSGTGFVGAADPRAAGIASGF
ncbi:MAG: gamma-glutamyltransferase [Armatimonadetes bacterium]|nr:gamma-glutamyltransferase [Armatimonadota bacterium]